MVLLLFRLRNRQKNKRPSRFITKAFLCPDAPEVFILCHVRPRITPNVTPGSTILLLSGVFYCFHDILTFKKFRIEFYSTSFWKVVEIPVTIRITSIKT